MTCQKIEAELVAFHFAVADDDARERIERHLVECASCVRAFVELKRGIETSEGSPPPRRAVRARLRSAVEDELGRGQRWSWWERPLAVALATLLVLAAGAGMRLATSVPAAPPRALGR